MTAPAPIVRVVRDAGEGGRFVAELLGNAAREAAAARGRFTLAIPGGSSPRAVFHALAAPASRQAFPWAQTQLLWVDERAVPVEHPDSNFGDFARQILPKLPLDAAQVHPMTGQLGALGGAAAYRETLGAVLGEGGSLDVALLGIGEDGHVASLFPGSPSLAAFEQVIGITDSPKPPPERITLSLPVLRGAKLVLVLGFGPGKADAVARSLAGEPLPARLVSAGPNAHWVIDEAAASQIAPGSI